MKTWRWNQPVTAPPYPSAPFCNGCGQWVPDNPKLDGLPFPVCPKCGILETHEVRNVYDPSARGMGWYPQKDTVAPFVAMGLVEVPVVFLPLDGPADPRGAYRAPGVVAAPEPADPPWTPWAPRWKVLLATLGAGALGFLAAYHGLGP